MIRNAGSFRVHSTACAAIVSLCLAAGAALAENEGTRADGGSLIAARLIAANSEISPRDIGVSAKAFPGALTVLDDAIGREARTTIFAGRPIHAADLRPAAIVERNGLVRITYTTDFISIHTDGRALDRGAPGDRVRVMNLSSRSTISGTVMPDGTIEVSE